MVAPDATAARTARTGRFHVLFVGVAPPVAAFAGLKALGAYAEFGKDGR